MASFLIANYAHCTRVLPKAGALPAPLRRSPCGPVLSGRGRRSALRSSATRDRIGRPGTARPIKARRTTSLGSSAGRRRQGLGKVARCPFRPTSRDWSLCLPTCDFRWEGGIHRLLAARHICDKARLCRGPAGEGSAGRSRILRPGSVRSMSGLTAVDRSRPFVRAHGGHARLLRSRPGADAVRRRRSLGAQGPQRSAGHGKIVPPGFRRCDGVLEDGTSC